MSTTTSVCRRLFLFPPPRFPQGWLPSQRLHTPFSRPCSHGLPLFAHQQQARPSDGLLQADCGQQKKPWRIAPTRAEPQAHSLRALKRLSSSRFERLKGQRWEGLSCCARETLGFDHAFCSLSAHPEQPLGFSCSQSLHSLIDMIGDNDWISSCSYEPCPFSHFTWAVASSPWR